MLQRSCLKAGKVMQNSSILLKLAKLANFTILSTTLTFCPPNQLPCLYSIMCRYEISIADRFLEHSLLRTYLDLKLANLAETGVLSGLLSPLGHPKQHFTHKPILIRWNELMFFFFHFFERFVMQILKRFVTTNVVPGKSINWCCGSNIEYISLLWNSVFSIGVKSQMWDHIDLIGAWLKLYLLDALKKQTIMDSFLEVDEMRVESREYLGSFASILETHQAHIYERCNVII